MSNYKKSSENIFADMKLPSAEDYLAKTKLAHEIAIIIEKQKFSQQKAASIIGTSQAKISNIVNGHLEKFTIDRLIQALISLDRDITIGFKPKPKSRRRATITVTPSHRTTVTA